MVIEGFTPHPDQRRVLNSIEDYKYIILTTGRQWGKTLLAINLILKWSLESANNISMWVAPVYSQSKKVFEQITNTIAGTPPVKSINKSNLEIQFINGSKIIFRSAEREDTLRGYTLDYMVIDEAAFIKDDVWNQVLKQTTLVKGKKILFTSTPKGRNFLYSLHIKGQEENQKNYISLKGTSYDTPYISADELDEARLTLPEDIFKQEILAEFIDDGGEVFRNIDNYTKIQKWSRDPNKKYYGGIDFGRQNDFTVLTILDEDGNTAFIYREKQQEWGTIVGKIADYLKEYQAICQVETNGIGDVLFEQLKKKYPRILPFTTTNTSKQNIIEDIIFATNEGRLQLPSKELFSPLHQELNTFTYEYNPRSRTIKYSAMSGGHDDIIMSIAIAYNTLKQRRTSGSYKIY